MGRVICLALGPPVNLFVGMPAEASERVESAVDFPQAAGRLGQ